LFWNWVKENWPLIFSSGIIGSIVSVGINIIIKSYFEKLRYRHEKDIEEWKHFLDLEVNLIVDQSNYHELIVQITNPNLVSKKTYKELRVERYIKTGSKGDELGSIMVDGLGSTGEVVPAGGVVEGRIHLQRNDLSITYIDSFKLVFTDERNRTYSYELKGYIREILDRLYISGVAIGENDNLGNSIAIQVGNPIPKKDVRLSSIEERNMVISSSWIVDADYGRFELKLRDEETIFGPSTDRTIYFRKDDITTNENNKMKDLDLILDEIISGKKRRLALYIKDETGRTNRFDKITYRVD